MAGPSVAALSQLPNLALEASLLSEEQEEERRHQQRLRNRALMDAHRATGERELERSRRELARMAFPRPQTRRSMFVGRRELRETPLRLQDLYLDGTSPPDTAALHKHHECSICQFVKSHPVSCTLRGHPRARDLLDLDTEEPGADEQLVADHGIYVAADGLSRQELLNIGMKKWRVLPTELRDLLGKWLPVPEYGDEQENDVPLSEPIAQGKRKEYASTRDPASLWRPLKAIFLDEVLRHEGMGDDLDTPRCVLCAVSLHTNDLTRQAFKCYDCGQYLQCGDCCLLHHQRTPLHVLQIRIHYCKCSKSDEVDNLEQLLRNGWYPATVTDPKTVATFRSLEAYWLYTVLGNMNMRDFVTAMERMTDATSGSRMTWLPDRYKQFQRMAWQWAFLKRVKRAGWGHDPAGVDKTKLGECTVICWAYLHDGHNLPENWHQELTAEHRFLYMLLVAVDTNFRLRNQMRANEINDPSLGPGWGCWVDPTAYKDHIKNYVYGNDWKVHLCERMKMLPQHMQLPLEDIELQCALPVWHTSSHNGDCKEVNSLSFKECVGKSDREGVEQTWAVLNPAAYATNDAGLGQQADTLEDRLDNHNYLKNVGQGDALWCKLVVAITERDKQIKVFEIVSATIEHDPNPYVLASKATCPSEAELWREEAALGAAGMAPLYGRSATAFLAAGIQIEDTQRRIVSELAGMVLVTVDRDSKIQEWHHTLLTKITRFRALQMVYMPGAMDAITTAEEERDSDGPPPKPEHIKLWMLSEMVADGLDNMLHSCIMGMLNMEARLRVAQCENSPVGLHSRLHAKRFLIDDRNANITGQVTSTKARVLIAQIGEWVDAQAKWYQQGRAALVALKGSAAYPYLRVLAPGDVTLDGDSGDMDAAAYKKLAMIGAERGACAPRNAPGTSKHVMSWIWTAPGAFDDEEEHLHDLIRVEWCRARAHKVRWSEEVMLLREEMRRVVWYLGWQTDWWRDRAEVRRGLTREVAAGVRAYALKQGDWHEWLGGFLH
ncbi:hypothetical protein B0H14DRAFT_3503214 [Mycena olivaceomarginata]|nr:hypothetical protein B0H14DRAFT_3503214 [Mycena olivaceomarginata]